MSTFDRAQEIIGKLVAEGVRATTDPAAVNPPCVLVVPPDLEFDLNCGFSATWRIICLAATATGSDRSTWAALSTLIEAVRATTDAATAELVAYTVNGTTFPSYVCSWTESID